MQSKKRTDDALTPVYNRVINSQSCWRDAGVRDFAMSETRSLNAVAAETLSKHVNQIFRRLPLVHARNDHHGVNVHKLRVSTRRAVEVVRAFKKVIGKKKARALREKLKRLRLAADQARDADVFFERLEKSPEEPGHELLLKFARVHRDQAQPELLNVQHQAELENWKAQFKSTLANLRERKEEKGQPKLKKAGRRYLRKALKEFIKASHGDLKVDSELHQFRIRGKRLRYAIEIFQDAFPPSLGGAIYTQIEGWQDQLGEINDRAVALKLLLEWSAKSENSDERQAFDTRLQRERNEHLSLRTAFMETVTARTLKTLEARMQRLLED